MIGFWFLKNLIRDYAKRNLGALSSQLSNYCQSRRLCFFVLALSLARLPDVEAQDTPYIRLGEAQIKKVLLAIAEPVFLGNSEVSKSYLVTSSTIFEVLSRDLSVVGIFQMLPRSASLDQSGRLKPVNVEKNGFSWDPWKASGAELLLKVGFFEDQNQWVLEAYFYHIGRAQTLFSQRYKVSKNGLRTLLHTLADDIVYQVSGTRSFLTKKLAFVAARPNSIERELFISDWDGENREQLTFHRTIVVSPAWSKDGKKIAYTAFLQRAVSKVRNADLLIYDLQSRKSKLISYRKGINSGAFFEPSGNLLITISSGESPDIYRIDPNGEILQKITDGPNQAMNVEPALSPDGQYLAFSSDRSGRPMIFISGPNGENPKRITFAGSFNAAPSWFPDSKKLAFAGWLEKAFDIYTINRDGSDLLRVTKAFRSGGRPASQENPDVSPDGRAIIYTSNRTGKQQIFLSLADGSAEWAITQDSWNYYQPRWSP